MIEVILVRLLIRQVTELVNRSTVGKLRLADVNFVALVLSRTITKKIKIILIKYVISCSKLFSFSDVF